MEQPKRPISLITPKGPIDDVWVRMLGQFWIRAALCITDPPEGPHLEPGTFRPRN